MTKTFVLNFKSYNGHPSFRSVQTFTVEARTLNAAINKVEKSNPALFFISCIDQWKGAANTYGVRC